MRTVAVRVGAQDEQKALGGIAQVERRRLVQAVARIVPNLPSKAAVVRTTARNFVSMMQLPGRRSEKFNPPAPPGGKDGPASCENAARGLLFRERFPSSDFPA